MDSILDRVITGLNKQEHFPSLPVFSCFAVIPEVHNDLFFANISVSLSLFIVAVDLIVFISPDFSQK